MFFAFSMSEKYEISFHKLSCVDVPQNVGGAALGDGQRRGGRGHRGHRGRRGRRGRRGHRGHRGPRKNLSSLWVACTEQGTWPSFADRCAALSTGCVLVV